MILNNAFADAILVLSEGSDSEATSCDVLCSMKGENEVGAATARLPMTSIAASFDAEGA